MLVFFCMHGNTEMIAYVGDHCKLVAVQLWFPGATSETGLGAPDRINIVCKQLSLSCQKCLARVPFNLSTYVFALPQHQSFKSKLLQVSFFSAQFGRI